MRLQHVVKVILALLLVLGCAQPVLAQDVRPTVVPGSEGAPTMPTPWEYWNRAKPFYCSQADKDRDIGALERQLAQVNAKADEARRYRQAMRQRMDQEFRDQQQAKYEADKKALDFFKREYLDQMTTGDPAQAEDELDKARKAPVINCKNRGAIAGTRPPIEPFPIPALPPCYKSQAQLDSLKADSARVRAAYEKKRLTVTGYKYAVQELARSKDADIAKAAKDELASAEFAAFDADLAEAFDKMNKFSNAVFNLKPCADDGNQQGQPPPPAPGKTKPISFEPGDGNVSLPHDAQTMLDMHNAARAEVGAAPLRWSPVLAEHAATWAEHLARVGRIEHSPREGRGIERENLNEGMLWWTTEQMMGNWLGEKRYFHGGIYPNVCEGDWSQCSHYSQMIWPTTTDLGCGEASGSGHKWLVCRYSPGGNKDGNPVGRSVYRSQERGH
jgi:uncharacterized protein YkwD